VCVGLATAAMAQPPAPSGETEPAAAVAEADAPGDAASDVVAPVEAPAAPPPAATPADNVTANERFVASTLEQFGRNSLRTAEAYLGLADAQRAAGEYGKAAESYVAAVDAYRLVDGPFTPLAIGPLTSLGDNYHEANDEANAVSAYSEARTVSRSYGLHNTQQVELLDRMSRSMLELNQVTEAEEQQVEALRLIQRSNAPDSDAVLAGIYKYAEWLGARGMFQKQRDQYMRALRIIRESGDEHDIRQVTPLLGIGNTYRQERNPLGVGYSSLQDALAVLLEQPEQDPLAIATTLRDLGDWSVAFGKLGYEGTEYQRAWQFLGSVPDGERLRAEWFSGANYVLYEPISLRSLSNDPDATRGFVTVSFDLDTRGNTGNLKLVESVPPGLKDEAILRHIRHSRFRPQMAEGALVPGEGLAIQVRFRYVLEDAVAAENDEERDSR
jgi:TonB family protein